MLYHIKGENYEVPIEQVHGGLTVYDEWLRGQNGRPITRQERLIKIESIAFALAPRQWMKDGVLQVDYYAPARLKKVLLSELGKRNRGSTKPKSQPGQLTLFRI